jgi:hypothetical protein
VTPKLKTHVLTPDPTVPPDHAGRRTCTCGLPEAHPRHELPPPVADVRQLAAHEED